MVTKGRELALLKMTIFIILHLLGNFSVQERLLIT